MLATLPFTCTACSAPTGSDGGTITDPVFALMRWHAAGLTDYTGTFANDGGVHYFTRNFVRR